MLEKVAFFGHFSDIYRSGEARCCIVALQEAVDWLRFIRLTSEGIAHRMHSHNQHILGYAIIYY